MFVKIFSAVTAVFLLITTAAVAIGSLTNPDEIARINVVEVQALQNHGAVVFVDTRTSGQWQNAVDKIPGAVRITSQPELDEFKRTVPPETPVVVYCT